MDVVCDKCSTKIKIPDNKLDKIPDGQVFSINCPKCKNKISVNKPAPPASKESPAPPASKESPAPPASKESPATAKSSSDPPPANEPSVNGSDGTPSDNPFGFLEEGAQTAMLCEPDAGVRAKIHEVLKNRNYHISEPPSPREALKQTRAHEFQVVILNELFGTRDPEANHVLKYLSSLKMNIRRNMFVVLMSNRFNTMDKMRAYNKSVNAVINVKDINEFEKYFHHSFNEYEGFYRVYKEVFKKIKG